MFPFSLICSIEYYIFLLLFVLSRPDLVLFSFPCLWVLVLWFVLMNMISGVYLRIHSLIPGGLNLYDHKASKGKGRLGPMGSLGPRVGRRWVARPTAATHPGERRRKNGNDDGNGHGNDDDQRPGTDHPTCPRAQG